MWGNDEMNDRIASNTATVTRIKAEYLIATAEQVNLTSRRYMLSVVAAALGIFLLAMVGFAPGIAHEAAHDVRHTAAFPCH